MCDCHHNCDCCDKVPDLGVLGIFLLPYAFIKMEQQRREAKKRQKEYEEEQKLEKARQAAARHGDAKKYAEFLAAERHHKSEIDNKELQDKKEKGIRYAIFGLIASIISGVLLLGNFLVCWAFGIQSYNIFSTVNWFVVFSGLLIVVCGILDAIEYGR